MKLNRFVYRRAMVVEGRRDPSVRHHYYRHRRHGSSSGWMLRPLAEVLLTRRTRSLMFKVVPRPGPELFKQGWRNGWQRSAYRRCLRASGPPFPSFC